MHLHTNLKKGNIVFGVIWTLFSSIFVLVGLWMTYSSLKKSMWEEVPCVVTELKVKANLKINPPFQPTVSYRYKFDNASYTGDTVSHGESGESDYEKLGKLVYQHQKKQIKFCYVNPENPEEAVLIKPSNVSFLGGLAFAAFGGFFVFIGCLMMRKGRKQPVTTSGQKDDKNGRTVMILFFSIFAFAGFITMFFLSQSAMTTMAAKNWQATPAKVIWSRVLSSRSDDTTTYRPEVFYRYEFNGLTHRSNNYKISRTSSSGRSGKQKVVDQHPRGKSITCYVNPEKPWQAVIEPKIGLGWLWLLFPLPFIAVGVGGLIMTFMKREASTLTKSTLSTASSTPTNSIKSSRPITQGEAVFSPGKKRIGHFFIAIVIALIWNGLIFFLLKKVLDSWQAGSPDWILSLFFIPFGLVGIGLLLNIPYRLLAIFNPAPVVTLANTDITIGAGDLITWEIPSSAHKIKQFRIFLRGQERVRYRRGTNTKTALSTFYEHKIIDTQDPRESASGSIDIILPEQATDLMPSWKGKHNSIIWTLEIKGDIPNWPDVSESYPVTVLPPTLTTQA